MADHLREAATQSIRRGNDGVLRASQGLVDSAWSLYRELQAALPEFATSLETSLQIIGQSLSDGQRNLGEGNSLSQASQEMLEQLSPILCDIGRHIFTMATTDASLESFLLPDNTLSIRVKTRLNELNHVAKGLSAELSTNDRLRTNTRLSHAQTDEVKNFWEMIFDDKEEVELREFYETISVVIGREPRCPLDRLASFFTCDYIDPLNFDRFVKIVDANNVQTANNKLLTGSATNVSQFLKSQTRIGHLRDAIPQGDSNEPIRALDSRTRNDSLTSSRLALSPRSENGDESMTSGLSNQSKVSSSAWLKIKVENWFREVDRLYRFFHGDIPKDDAEALLRGRLPGTFLLRYSCTNPSRLCVSFVHSIPISDNNSWKEQVHRRDVILHHELLCTNVKESNSPRQGGDIRRRFSCDDLSPRRERKAVPNRQKDYGILFTLVDCECEKESSIMSLFTAIPRFVLRSVPFTTC